MRKRQELTIGQLMGVLPLHSCLSRVYQYKSKLDEVWRDTIDERDCLLYSKCGYQTRVVWK